MTIPDDVVELAARETYAKATAGRWATLGDSRRDVWLGVMRHVLSLPAVRAALAPSPTPRVSQAERLARAWHASTLCIRGGIQWDDVAQYERGCWVRAFQALIDDGTIPAEPEPDVAEMLRDAYWDLDSVDTHATSLWRFGRLMDDGWQFIPPGGVA